MKRIFLLIAIVALSQGRSVYAEEQTSNTKSSTVFIANYDSKGSYIGWGSGFFVDEGIVITNKHVIEGATYYRIFSTNADDSVDIACYKDIGRTDVKINLDDDVAYIRVYINCEHGVVQFADRDPLRGEEIGVIGYPNQGTLAESMNLYISTGSVTGEIRDSWLRTDAYIHFGNSGGPVVQDGYVVGVAVAKSLNSDGTYAAGYFVPTSIIIEGLLNANNSTFGYTAQDLQNNNSYKVEPETFGTEGDPFDPVRKTERAYNRDCMRSLGEGAEATGYSGCECKPSYHVGKNRDTCEPGAEGYIDPYQKALRPTASSSSSSSAAPKTTSPDFTDYNDSNPGYTAVMALRASGVINGYPDGSFQPQGNINRAELMKILIEGFYEQENLGETDCFPDVQNQWFAPYVCAGKRLGWVSGYPDGTFGPSNSVNRAEGIKIVMSSLTSSFKARVQMPRDVPTGSWFFDFVGKAIEQGIVMSDTVFKPAESLTREDAAVWIYRGS
jgi:hypothetical protein